MKNLSNTQRTLLKILVALGIYFFIKYFVPYGQILLHPVNLLVTFLHEFGHAMGALLTGGYVDSIQINSDGSGFCRTAGGWRSIVLMGGYLGSAILGNILLHIGLSKPSWSRNTLYVIAGFMLFTGFWWFNLSRNCVLIELN